MTRTLGIKDYLRIANLWGPRTGAYGTLQDPAQVRALVERDLAHLPTMMVTIVAPGGTREHPAPGFTFSSRAPEGSELFAAEYPRETVTLDFDVVKYAKFVYGSVLGHGHAGDDDGIHLLDACRRVTRIIDSPFAFGDDRDTFVDPDLVDPRSRAWGIMYYGPDEVRALGRDQLETAPAARVEFEADGGAWVYLAEHPFEISETKEKVRVAVAEHLRLEEIFPNEA